MVDDQASGVISGGVIRSPASCARKGFRAHSQTNRIIVKTSLGRRGRHFRLRHTARAAHWLQQPASANMVVLLHGDLAPARPRLVRHLLRRWASPAAVKSPAYAVVEPLCNPVCVQVWHFDFYRLRQPREWEVQGCATSSPRPAEAGGDRRQGRGACAAGRLGTALQRWMMMCAKLSSSAAAGAALLQDMIRRRQIVQLTGLVLAGGSRAWPTPPAWWPCASGPRRYAASRWNPTALRIRQTGTGSAAPGRGHHRPQELKPDAARSGQQGASRRSQRGPHPRRAIHSRNRAHRSRPEAADLAAAFWSGAWPPQAGWCSTCTQPQTGGYAGAADRRAQSGGRCGAGSARSCRPFTGARRPHPRARRDADFIRPRPAPEPPAWHRPRCAPDRAPSFPRARHGRSLRPSAPAAKPTA